MKNKVKLLMVLSLIFLLSGCSEVRKQAPGNGDSGKKLVFQTYKLPEGEEVKSIPTNVVE